MRAKILIVDDNDDNLYMLDALLRASGYEVEQSSNGAQALEKLRSQRFDMVIADILMPVMDGFQLCRECRKNPETRNVLFVFYTATYTDDRDERLALTLGADSFIRKPIEPDKLVSIVRDLLDQKGAGGIHGRKPPTPIEQEVLSLYNQRLVEKLENKILDLKTSQTRYQNLWENVSDLIFSLDEDDRVLDINHCFDMLGYERADIIGKPLADLLVPESRKTAQDRLNRPPRKDGRSQDVYEATILRKDGNRLTVEFSMCTVYVDGRFLGRYGIARDVTERKKAEQALKEAAAELNTQKEALQQKNIALREVLTQIEAEKEQMQKQVIANVHKLAMPALRRLRRNVGETGANQVAFLEQALTDLTSGFGVKISGETLNLTPRQIQICGMIRAGMSSKDIAEALHVSIRTVETHRNSIRKKLGISTRNVQLSSRLQSIA